MPDGTTDPLSVLVVVTSHGSIDHRPTTGVWFTEFSEPYAALIASGAAVTVASPRGGPAPVDPRGYPSRSEIAEVRDALEVLNATLPLDQVDVADHDGVFFPGGHGPMFDLATDVRVKRYVRDAWEAGKPVAAVCHGPAALLDVALSDGTTLLHGRRVTGFTRGEDAEDALFAAMPFALQERMSGEGAAFVEQPPRTVHVETDGLLVTGQNPASARATAEAFLAVLARAPGAPAAAV